MDSFRTVCGPREGDRCDGDVVFLHGLGGDPEQTWQIKGQPGTFWPLWLCQDIPNIAVHSIGYEAEPSSWLGRTMPIVDRATNLLATLEAHRLGGRSTILIGHSLGGLLIKEMLRTALTMRHDSWEKIGENVRGVVFLATPHQGSRMADYITALRHVFRPTVSISELGDNSAPLRSLNLWYRNNASARNINTYVLFETQPTRGVQVVDEASADPGIENVIPIPITADHIAICKPPNRDDLIYLSVKSFVSKILRSSLQENLDDDSFNIVDVEINVFTRRKSNSDPTVDIYVKVTNHDPQITVNQFSIVAEISSPQPEPWFIGFPVPGDALPKQTIIESGLTDFENSFAKRFPEYIGPIIVERNIFGSWAEAFPIKLHYSYLPRFVGSKTVKGTRDFVLITSRRQHKL